MASRANLSGRPGPTGVLDRVMNPLKQRAGLKPQGRGGMSAAVTPSPDEPGGGVSGMVGRAAANAKAKQQQQRQAGVVQRAASAVEPTAPPTAPAAGGAVQRAMARSKPRRGGLSSIGASQAELAGETQPMRSRASLSDRMARAQGTLADQEVAAEVGGGRTVADVTGPSLNRARRPGRTYRR